LKTKKKLNSVKTKKTAKKKVTTLAKRDSSIQVKDPVVNEIAGAVGFDLERFQYLMATHDPNPIHKNPKFTGMQLFYEMDTDSRVYNVMRILKDGLRRRQSWIRPGDNSEDQAIKTGYTILNLKRVDDLKQKKKEIMGCLDYGVSFTEMILGFEDVSLEYEFDGKKKTVLLKNAVVVKDLKSKPVTAFWFDEKNRVYFSGNLKENPYFGLMSQSQEATPLTEEQLKHFIIATHDPRFGSRYGWSVKVSMFPCYLMKKAVKLWRLIFVNRYGMPIPHGKYKPGTSKTGPGGTDEFKRRLAGIQTAAHIMTPEGFAVEFLKGMQAGDLDPYQNLLDYADYEIAEAGLGHREATSQAGTGSYASEVLKSTAIRQEILEANGGTLDTTFNDQYIKRLLDWNFPSTGIYPKQETDTSAMRDLNATITQYQLGNTMLELKKSQIYRDMSWERPEDPDDTIPVNNSMTFQDRSDVKENLNMQEIRDDLKRLVAWMESR
jgi:hypothetical protein